MGNLLALDLGTTTGWATGNSKTHASGVFELKPGRFEGGGIRFVKFRAKLRELHAAWPVTLLVYEEVRRHRGTDAAHVYGGLQAIVTEWCEEQGIPYEGVPVGEIKKFWTGKGNADKSMMIDVAVQRGYAPIDDNEADALALFHLRVVDLPDTSLPAAEPEDALA